MYNGEHFLLDKIYISDPYLSGGDIAWTLAATALVWIMIPGVGFFYSGLLRRKNALSMIYLSMMCLAVVSFEVWILFNVLRTSTNDMAVVLLGILFSIQRYRGQVHW